MTTTKNIALSDLFWDDDILNVSRQTGLHTSESSRNDLGISLVLKGFDATLGVPKIFKLSSDQKEYALQALQARWEALQRETEDWTIKYHSPDDTGDDAKPRSMIITADDRRRSFRDLHISDNGEFVVPTYGITDANRRVQSIETFGNPGRFNLGLDTIEKIPCTIVAYSNEKERIADCIRSNVGKLVGNQKMDNISLLKAVKSFYQQGCSERDVQIQCELTRGKAQQLYRLCALDAGSLKTRFSPDIQAMGIVDNICSGAEDAWKINSFEKEAVQNLLCERKDPKKDLGTHATTVEDVEHLAIHGAKKAPKIADKGSIEDMMRATPILGFKFVLKAILDNDLGRLSVYVPFTEALNECPEGMPPFFTEAVSVEKTEAA